MATYSTWNPLDKNSNLTLSNGDLTYTQTTTSYWYNIRSTVSVSSGKWYWEHSISGSAPAVGIGNSSETLGSGNHADSVGSSANGWSYWYTGSKNHDASLTSYGNSYTNGAVISVALDMDNGEVYFAKNGVWQNSSDPVTRTNPAFTGISGSIFAMNSSGNNGDDVTSNFGASSFTYTVPSGYNSGLYTGGTETEAAAEESIEITDDASAQNLTDIATESISAADAAEAYDFSGQAAENLNITDAADFVIEVEAEASENTTITDVANAVIEIYAACSEELSISDISTALNWTKILAENYGKIHVLYYCTLTGDADGTTDLALPISSFSCRIKNNAPSYLQAVTPGLSYSSEISTRSNGDLKVDIVYLSAGTILNRETLCEVELEDIRLDVGSENISITLSGHKTKTYANRNLTLENTNYYSLSSGEYTYRFALPSEKVKPGDSVTVNSDTFIIDTISINVSEQNSQMELSS